jgi:hypothetical protein
VARKSSTAAISRQGLIALGAILVLVIAVTVGSVEDAWNLVVGLLLLACYFIPTIIGIVRKHPQIAPIIIINVLLGWTIICWIVALIWSVASFSREVSAPPSAP